MAHDDVVRTLSDVEIPMRDGVILRANVMLPNPLPAGGAPALLTRTAYGKDTGVAIGAVLVRLVARGYAVVVQDKRGRFASDGEYRLLRDDAGGATGGHLDGYDTVEWVAAQEWCDGRVATFGLSYLGYAAIGAAVTAPPHLATAIVAQPSSDEYTDRTFTDGVLTLQNVVDWVSLPIVAPDLIEKLSESEHADASAELEALRDLGDARYRVLPLRDMPFLRRIEHAWAGPLAHREDEAYFAENRIGGAEVAHIRVPILHVGGWYDLFTRNTLRQFELASRLSPAGAQHRLVMGPWAHAQLAADEVAGIAFPDAAIDETALTTDWAARLMPGAGPSLAETVDDWPRAIIYVLGANRWRAEPEWPILGTEVRSLALQPDGIAAFAAPEPGARTFRDDPAWPYTAPAVSAGPVDASAHLGEHTLAYESAPVTEPLEVTGWPRAELAASTTGTDADWLVELHVVGADGGARLLTDGIARSRYRHTRAVPAATEPGRVERIEVHLRPVSVELQVGERLRVVVSGGKFPAYERNPGVFVDLDSATEADFLVTTRTIVAATLELPIVPIGARGEWIDNPWPAV